MNHPPAINTKEHRAAVSLALGVSHQAISNWNSRGVPIEHCAAIERATGGQVARKDLRPDDYWLIWPELAAPSPAEQGA